MEGINTVDGDSVIVVELVDCEMTVVETGVMVELVTNVVVAGGTVLERIVELKVTLGIEDDSGITEVVGIGLGVGDSVDRELVKIVLGEDVGR